ncbi:MAG: homoserine dehydrogenase [Proteobacteria bacterium]|nr:homoserine dehydrogenase [Pseudomonadota bacterium]
MKKLRIGLAGLGVVGRGVYEIIQKDSKLLTLRTQVELEIVAVSARTKKDFLEPKIKFYASAIDLANDPEIDVIVEVIGGDGVAKDLIETAIKNGKKIVTANKALLAIHGFELAKLVEKYQSCIGFEASVAGATPAIKTAKENLAGNQIKEIHAILNGTSNFILTKMKEENLDFSLALKQAQELGYAEADPSSDIKGLDTAHKIILLAAIAFGSKPNFAKTYIEGIDEISIDDIKLADEFGYKIKLLATAKSGQQTVYPALIKKSEQVAQVDGAFNAILFNASNAGQSLIVGLGAGSVPTASAIVSDLVDIARENQTFLFGVKREDLVESSIGDISQRIGKYFLRLFINKNSGAEKIFDGKIKIEQAAFFERGDEILCGFLTGEQKESELDEALKNLDPALVQSAKFIRVETTNF